jgi:putative ABC transport system permease protein
MGTPKEPLWRRYLRFFGPDVDADIEEELRFHLDMRERNYVERGLSRADAREAARRRFGDLDQHRRALRRQDTRRHRKRRMAERFGEWGQDLRYAGRMLRQHRGFSLAVIATLGLGIGATTAIFSAVDAALLRPLPFADPSRLVELRYVHVPWGPRGVEEPDARPSIRSVGALRDVFTDVAAYAAGGLNLSGIGAPLRVKVGVVTEGFFRTLGARPENGRTFAPEEGRPGSARVTVISHGLWQRQFGGRNAVGLSLRLNSKAYQVVGVMPPEFVFPEGADLWIPLTVPMTWDSFEAFRGYISTVVIGRLASGVSKEIAAERLRTLWRALPADQAAEAREVIANPIGSFQRLLVGDRRTPMLILLGATGLLLLIACVNATNLLLAHAATRERELAVRVVLGAGRGRLVRQLLVQSVVLALAGAVLGLGLAVTTLGLVRALLPTELAELVSPRIDGRLFGFATGLALVTALAFGTLPALWASRAQAGAALKGGGGHGATSMRRGRVRRVLVMAEVALALVLLAGSGLMLRSFAAVLETDPGFASARIGSVQLAFDRTSYPNPAVRMAAIDRLAAAARRIPGVEEAGVVNDLPLSGLGGIAIQVNPEHGPVPKDAKDPYARYLRADAGYFRAMNIRLLAGRLMTPADDSLAPKVAVISERMAREVWPGQEPLGKRIALLDPDEKGWRTIVGVVSDVRESGLDEEAKWQMYYPLSEAPSEMVALVARARIPKGDLLPALLRVVREVDPNQAVVRTAMLDDLVHASLAARRSNTGLITAFGALALLLAAIGVYGVVSYGVTQRTRELGIRAALGARKGELVRLVLREGLVLGLVGTAVGVAGALALTGLLRALLYGVEPGDPVAIGGAALFLLIPVLVAAFIPARRAARLDPVEVMRAE